MGLNLELVKAHAKVFGAPAYESTGVIYGDIKPGEYTLDVQYNSIKVALPDGTFMSCALRGMKADEVDAAKATFKLEQFVAVSDIAPSFNDDGTVKYAGVTKGAYKDYATLVA